MVMLGCAHTPQGTPAAPGLPAPRFSHCSSHWLYAAHLCPISPGGRGDPLGLLCTCGHPPWSPQGAERPAGPANVKSLSAASGGLGNLTPGLSLFGGLYHGPWVQGSRHTQGNRKSDSTSFLPPQATQQPGPGQGSGCVAGAAAQALI